MNRKINASRERKKICSRVSARVKTQSLSVSRPNKWLSKTAQWNEAFHSPDVWNYFTIKRCQSRWRTLNAACRPWKRLRTRERAAADDWQTVIRTSPRILKQTSRPGLISSPRHFKVDGSRTTKIILLKRERPRGRRRLMETNDSS